MSWSNKVVMITGASSGIGRGLALYLGKRGARLGLSARRKEELDELVREVSLLGGKAVALPVDVQDAEAVRDAAERLRAEFGEIDTLIANAGIGGNNNAEQLSAADFA